MTTEPTGSPRHWSWKRFFLVNLFLVLAVWPFIDAKLSLAERQRAARKADGLIRAVLASQESAWNAGDLDGFMAGYWKSDDLKFLSGDTVTTGWQATYDRYQQRYKADGKEMGQLKFDILDVDVVSGDAVVARGTWALILSDGKTPRGLFTLLFRRIDGEWVIVSDHTSVAEK